MGGVRARKSRRARANDPTSAGKKKRKFVKPSIGSKVLQSQWDKSKTLKQNLQSVGLAYNPNAKISLQNKKMGRKQTKQQDAMDVEAGKSGEATNTTVIEAFEKQAAEGINKVERNIPPGEAQFLFSLINAHGSDYAKMARDKRNTYQHTANQLRRKC